MRERETASEPAEESGRRRTSIAAWMMGIVASFALGAVVTHFALFREPISQFSLQAFLASPFWSTASVGLVCFVVGAGFAYLPFSWYREDTNRTLKTEYRDLRDKTEALRNRTESLRDRMDAPPRAPLPARPAKPIESAPEPEYAEGGDGPQDIAAVISEMSAAIKANLRETGPARPAEVDLRQAMRSTSSGE
jgi:hypothetical protein